MTNFEKTMLEICLENTQEILDKLGTVPRFEVSEDCISREDAINAIMTHFIPQTYTGDDVDQALRLAHKIIDNAPSVVPTTEQSSMVGEWIKEYNGNGWNDYWDYTCSNCGKKYERGDSILYNSSYCPNCGAKMRGEE